MTPTRSRALRSGGGNGTRTHLSSPRAGFPNCRPRWTASAKQEHGWSSSTRRPALTDAIRSVMRYANFVLVPTQDGITDLKAIGRTVQLIRELDRPYAFALTFVKPGLP